MSGVFQASQRTLAATAGPSSRLEAIPQQFNLQDSIPGADVIRDQALNRCGLGRRRYRVPRASFMVVRGWIFSRRFPSRLHVVWAVSSLIRTLCLPADCHAALTDAVHDLEAASYNNRSAVGGKGTICPALLLMSRPSESDSVINILTNPTRLEPG